ncbi:hypothetical protein [Geminicoccus harenae]|uniref:hypothetical protein n=1 Tax=Geminicoccus harenae TaxID=2498453 RepID=UPI00168A9D38|nr:hypothetical protein [Geminicoccus harenae]
MPRPLLRRSIPLAPADAALLRRVAAALAVDDDRADRLRQFLRQARPEERVEAGEVQH